MNRSQKYLAVAALLSFLTAAIHVFGGGPEIHDPALASSLSAEWKAVFSTIWHQITLLLLIVAGFLGLAAARRQLNEMAIWLVISQYGSIGVLFIFYGIGRLGNIFVLPQWVIFFTISLVLWLSIRSSKRENI